MAKHISTSGALERAPTSISEERGLMLFAELQRRLRHFREAAVVLELLKSLPRVEVERHPGIIAFEAELVSKRDSEPHYVPVDGEEPAGCGRPKGPVPFPKRESSNQELFEAQRKESDERLRLWCAKNESVVFGPENFVQAEMQDQCSESSG